MDRSPTRERIADDAERTPSLSIVALDDDPDFREYIRDVLTTEGHRVRVVATPGELYDANEQELPDVVLLDMKMGASTGDEVLVEIRKRWARLCVVVVTGYPSMDTMRATFKRDVYDYLSKPFSLDELRGVLAQAAQDLGLGGRPQDKLRSELGRQIRLTRTERGWTLKELSERSSVSVSQLSSIERGAHLPSLESLLAISMAMEAKPSEWLGAAGF